MKKWFVKLGGSVFNNDSTSTFVECPICGGTVLIQTSGYFWCTKPFCFEGTNFAESYNAVKRVEEATK